MKHPRILERGESEASTQIEKLYRGGTFEVASVEQIPSGDDGADFLVMEFTFGSDYEARRWFGFESVVWTREAADLSRVVNGVAPVLLNHNAGEQIGVVERVTIESERRARARVRFSRGKAAHDVVQDIVDGIRRGVSFGYDVHEMELWKDTEQGPHYRATAWEFYELTFASLPVDPTVGSHRSKDGLSPTRVRRVGLKEDEAVKMVRAYHVESKSFVEVAESEIDGKTYLRAIDAPEPSEPPAATTATPATTEPAPPAAPSGVHVRSDNSAPSANDDGMIERERKRVREVTDVTKRFKASDELTERAMSEGWDAGQTFNAIQLERALAGETDPIAPPATEIGLTERQVGDYRITRLVETLYARSKGNTKAMCPEIEMSQAVADQIGEQAQGAFVPHDVMHRGLWGMNPVDDLSRRAVSTTTPGGGPGGNLIATELRAGSFIEVLRNRTIAGALGVTIVPGLVGDVTFPKQTGDVTPGWVAEGAGAGSSDPTFGLVSMSPKTIRARTDMTRRMRQQSTPGIEMIVRETLMRSVGIHVDAAVFDGGGGDAPTGVRSQAGVTTLPYLTTTGLSELQSIVALETLVAAANADIGTAAYATTPTVRGRLKTRYVSSSNDGPPIWTGRAGDGELNGHRAVVTNNLPRTLGAGTNEHAFMYGVWNQVLVGEWGVLDIMPDEITLADSGGLAIRAFQDIDVALRHALSFAMAQLIP